MLKYDKLFTLLEEHGLNTTQIRKQNIMGQATYYGLKNGTKGIDAKTINKLCEILNCQPGDIMEYIPDNPNVNYSLEELYELEKFGETNDIRLAAAPNPSVRINLSKDEKLSPKQD